MRASSAAALVLLLACGIGGCQATLYRALESVGIEKRQILVNRVSAARDAQTEAKEQFSSALEQFRSIVKVEGGELERTYDRLNAEYERSQQDAAAARERIDEVESVAEDLFDEWEEELDDYSNASLRRDSQRLLADTRKRYSALIASMRRAERTMEPVLDVFEDQVLSLKHSLNARAIGSLRSELASIERQTAALVADMERAIAEADRFIRSMRVDS